MFTNEEAYLIKTILGSIQGLGGDTKEIEKALSVVLDFDKISEAEKTEVVSKLTTSTKG